MRRIILLSAMSLLLSATEAAAQCDLPGTWRYSALATAATTSGQVVFAYACACDLSISSDGTITILPSTCLGDCANIAAAAAPYNGLNGLAISPITCSLSGIGGGCGYEAQVAGDTGAGVAECSFNRATFDLIKR